jgi:tRNA(adenine34) deaminase
MPGKFVPLFPIFNLMTYHQRYMQQALDEARLALALGEVPVGAIIIRGEEEIARAHNLVEARHDPTAHAEMIAIAKASRRIGSRRLEGCALYVTLEPCPMCAGAIVNARLSTLFFGAFDVKAGAAGTLYAITTDGRLNHRVETHGGILDDESAALLRRFFRARRGDAADDRAGEYGMREGDGEEKR